jgi:hypothetical protein
MARYTATIEVTAPSAGQNLANWVAGSACNFKLRRAFGGTRNSSATTPQSQQIEIAIFRATARGTQTTNVAGQALDPRDAADPTAGLDTAWSVQPTLATNPLWRIPFNDQAGFDVPWEGYEELGCDQGTANGLCFQNVGTAVPSGTLVVLTIEIEN